MERSPVAEYVEDEYSCRICLEPAGRREVIAPCACKGSSKWVHRGCLDRWRTTREDKAFSKCTECLQQYTLIARVDDSLQPRLIRQAKFFFLVLRDFSAAFLMIQLMIIAFSWLVYTSDSKSSMLLKYFHSSAHAQMFYYFSGVIIFLAILGMIYFCRRSSANCSACDRCSTCTGPEYCCDMCCYNPYGYGGSNHFYSPYYFYDTPGLMCVDCGGCGGGGLGGVHHCCQVPMCLEFGSCTCCTDTTCCMDAFGTTVSEECFPVFLVLVLIFAFVGAIVAVLAGTLYLQKVIRTHVHVLQKRGLANDYIVADLDMNKENFVPTIVDDNGNPVSDNNNNGNMTGNIMNRDQYDNNSDNIEITIPLNNQYNQYNQEEEEKRNESSRYSALAPTAFPSAPYSPSLQPSVPYQALQTNPLYDNYGVSAIHNDQNSYANTCNNNSNNSIDINNNNNDNNVSNKSCNRHGSPNRTRNSTYAEEESAGLSGENNQYNNFQHTPSAPPLSLAQKRELSSLGLL